MAPQVKITREMIINAAFELTRSGGDGSVNARSVAKALGCSTQPVMYHFARTEDLKKAVFEKADKYHTQYLTDIKSDEPMKDIGLNFIRFASSEKNLFRFLFQSDKFSGKSISDLVSDEATEPIIQILSKEANIGADVARAAFKYLALYAYGYASMLANNDMIYDENAASKELENLLEGAIYAATKE